MRVTAAAGAAYSLFRQRSSRGICGQRPWPGFHRPRFAVNDLLLAPVPFNAM
ncbi:hypothetical protein H1S01_02065 [Heliobacterium chlorum]|uniref:Uncharacterized protein n=1 Tax=Heliobacterium chlorum TaxID=2698 RepID=A0ABR7T0A7_HELCL|nr:hypothetical protein [Heliobacterium chlorum]MBC9783294.1 hypothetical protein [Heliobacterium chlorum]